MAQDLNQCIFIGNLTRDPELRRTQSGVSCANFSIAVNRRPAQDGTRAADYINIVAWRQLAELCVQYLHKGSKIAVCSHCQTRNYEKDGHKVYVTEFVADSIQFLTPRNDQQQSANVGYDDNGQSAEFTEVEEDSLPF